MAAARGTPPRRPCGGRGRNRTRDHLEARGRVRGQPVIETHAAVRTVIKNREADRPLAVCQFPNRDERAANRVASSRCASDAGSLPSPDTMTRPSPRRRSSITVRSMNPMLSCSTGTRVAARYFQAHGAVDDRELGGHSLGEPSPVEGHLGEPFARRLLALRSAPRASPARASAFRQRPNRRAAREPARTCHAPQPIGGRLATEALPPGPGSPSATTAPKDRGSGRLAESAATRWTSTPSVERSRSSWAWRATSSGVRCPLTTMSVRGGSGRSGRGVAMPVRLVPDDFPVARRRAARRAGRALVNLRDAGKVERVGKKQNETRRGLISRES